MQRAVHRRLPLGVAGWSHENTAHGPLTPVRPATLVMRPTARIDDTAFTLAAPFLRASNSQYPAATDSNSTKTVFKRTVGPCSCNKWLRERHPYNYAEQQLAHHLKAPRTTLTKPPRRARLDLGRIRSSAPIRPLAYSPLVRALGEDYSSRTLTEQALSNG